MPRLFVALTPPPVVRNDLVALQEPLAGVGWINPAHLHLTLRFIGECTEERQEAFVAALERVHVEPFVLPVAGTGVFPPGARAAVIWAGVGHGHTRLHQLRQQVDDALLSAALELDVRHFHPHFTVGRVRGDVDAKALARYLRKHAEFEAPPFRVAEFQLVASVLRPAGPEYSVVKAYPLAK